MSTFVPRPPYSDAELAALYPPHLRLHQVQVLLRHGERAPVNARFVNAGLAPFWPLCSAVRHMRSAVLDPHADRFSHLDWKRRLETMDPDGSPVVASGPNDEVDGICDMGMLTDRGRETTFQLGQRLRKLYVDQLGFLPPTISSTDFIYLRSTPVPRALESLQQTFVGLYPPRTRADHLAAPTIISRSVADETLFPNDSHCRRFAALTRAFAQRAADRWNDTQEMAFLTDKIGKWMPQDSPKVAVDSHPRLSGIMDSINATAAHAPAVKLPQEFFDPKVKQIVEKIGVQEWYDGYRESQEFRTLGIGGLLGDILLRMVQSTEHPPSSNVADGNNIEKPWTISTGRIRMGLSGCHDTTLAAALASLGAFDEDAWPPFTSHVAFELFQRAATSGTSSPTSTSTPTSHAPPSNESSWRSSLFRGTSSSPTSNPAQAPFPQLSRNEKNRLEGFYVRVRYNDRPVTIPGCREAGKHFDGDESFCTLEAFKSIVDKFTPRDWKQQCRTNITAPAFPAKPENAGY